jgi:hypothetical protein
MAVAEGSVNDTNQSGDRAEHQSGRLIRMSRETKPLSIGEPANIHAELIMTDEGTFTLRLTLDREFGLRFNLPQSRLSSTVYYEGFESSGGPRTEIAIHLKEKA